MSKRYLSKRVFFKLTQNLVDFKVSLGYREKRFLTLHTIESVYMSKIDHCFKLWDVWWISFVIRVLSDVLSRENDDGPVYCVYSVMSAEKIPVTKKLCTERYKNVDSKCFSCYYTYKFEQKRFESYFFNS